MSTAAVSSSSLHQQLQTYFQTRTSDVQQLGQSLQSGDLAGAQQAFNAISQLGQNGPFASGDPFLSSQREQDFNAIGSALQSGDLAGAQSAFAALQSTFKGRGGNNGGAITTTGGGGSVAPEPPVVILNLGNSGSASSTSGTGSATSAATSAAGSTAATGAGAGSSPEEIALSFSNSSGVGEQLNIAVGNQQGPTQQLQLNLAQNEQIVLNLFNATANSTPQSSGVSVVA